MIERPAVQPLLLWDIDGTLLTTDGIAAAAMKAAIREVIGTDVPMVRTSYAGKTDWQIIRESLPSVDEATVAARLYEFAAAYTGRLQQAFDQLTARSTVFTGVVAALNALTDHAFQAPLTGNIAAAARIKLDAVGLLPLLDLHAGAFGDDHHHRPSLVPIAARRAAQRYQRSFAEHQIVIIGDTPNDIICGRANNARTVAVATGAFTLDQLAAHQPDALLPDLSDLNAVLAAVLG